jgi:hypothetical protein
MLQHDRTELTRPHVLDGVAAVLGTGASFSFADWPNDAVPRFGAGVYTVWHDDGRFIYVGMSGRGITDQTIPRNNPHGLHTRLASHASGRRSGDQFCVYVADRLVLPTLTPSDISAICSGDHQMDAFVRCYIHANLRYRYLMLPDGATAFRYEGAIKSGEWEHGRPLLNPGKLVRRSAGVRRQSAPTPESADRS